MDKLETKKKILVVDDDQELLSYLPVVLGSEGTVLTASSPQKAIETLKTESIDLAIVDLDFQGEENDGIFLLNELSASYSGIPVIVLSGDRRTDRVVNATRFHLVDFVVKNGKFHETLRRAAQKGLQVRAELQTESESAEFATRSPLMLRVLGEVTRIARSESQGPILIRGESGTGKEILARYIAHLLKKSMVSANMAAIPQELVENELFGSVSGSYTGSVRDKEGLIPKANHKIFFLDEIGDCSLRVQASLLRVIQEGEIRPVGSTQTKEISVRFLAATNKNLEEMVLESAFRDDLLQRLSAFPVHIPPLRERPEDIVGYAERFFAECSPHRQFFLFSGGERALLDYKWPGNVRELWNAIQRLIALSPSRTVDADAVLTAIKMGGGHSTLSPKIPARLPSRDEIIATLEKMDGNRTQTAALFGVHKVTLLRWLKGYGLERLVPGKSGRPKIFPAQKA